MIAARQIARAPMVAPTSLTVGPGEYVALLGANGAGKTSLLRLLLGLTRPDQGTVTLGGDPISALTPVERARRVAYLPQMRPIAWPARVRDVVALGRFAHGAAPDRLGGDDRRAVDAALGACALEALAERSVDSLSGGEQARVHVARALAAEAPLIVADEPVAALDPHHQHRVLALLRGFVDRGGGVLAVLHDLGLAARYADRAMWMRGGRLVADGSIAETMTPQRIADTYQVAARVEQGVHGLEVFIESML